MPKVLNKRRGDRGGVYVGRPTKWGNPYIVGKHGTREEVVAKYREYLIHSGLLIFIDELRGKDLLCWCAPEPCHADVLLEFANAHKEEAEKPSPPSAA